MKKEDIEKKLDTAVSGMIPEDMFERISKEIASKDVVRVKKGINKKICLTESLKILFPPIRK